MILAVLQSARGFQAVEVPRAIIGPESIETLAAPRGSYGEAFKDIIKLLLKPDPFIHEVTVSYHLYREEDPKF